MPLRKTFRSSGIALVPFFALAQLLGTLDATPADADEECTTEFNAFSADSDDLIAVIDDISDIADDMTTANSGALLAAMSYSGAHLDYLSESGSIDLFDEFMNEYDRWKVFSDEIGTLGESLDSHSGTLAADLLALSGSLAAYDECLN